MNEYSSDSFNCTYAPLNDTCGPSDVNALDQYADSYGYVALVICSLGILGNIANIIVLSRPKMASFPINFLLMMMALFHLLLLVIQLPNAVYFHIIGYETNKFRYYSYKRVSAEFLKTSLIIGTFFHTTALWHTIAVAFFRWLTLGVNNGKAYCTMKTVRICSAVLILANAGFTIPFWMSYEVICFVHSDCYYSNVTFWTVSPNENEIPLWAYSVLGKTLPSLLLTCLTIPLVCIMKAHARHKREMVKRGCNSQDLKKQYDQRRTTGMLFAVMMLFLCIELPHGMFMIALTFNYQLSGIYTSLATVIDTATILSFSASFILYTTMSRLFRRTFYESFCKSIRESQGFHQLSTVLTSIKQSSTQKRSSSYAMVNGDDLRQAASDNSKSNLLHPASPLLRETTHSTSLGSSSCGITEHL